MRYFNFTSSIFRSSIFVIFLTLSTVSFASISDLQQIPDLEKQQILSKLQTKIPALKVESIFFSPVDNLYQVTSGSDVFYITKDHNFFFHGTLIDLSKDRNSWDVSSNYKKSLVSKKMHGINKEDLIVFSPTKKSLGHIIVFTDPDCGYCRKFHDQMDQMLEAGIEVRYASFPRGGKQSSGFDKAVSIWCSDNPKEAMNIAKKGQNLESKKCENNPVAKLFDLGRSMGINATPTLIYADGTLMPGYLPVERLVEEIKKH